VKEEVEGRMASAIRVAVMAAMLMPGPRPGDMEQSGVPCRPNPVQDDADRARLR
jgi:hypothetical protein